MIARHFFSRGCGAGMLLLTTGLLGLVGLQPALADTPDAATAENPFQVPDDAAFFAALDLAHPGLEAVAEAVAAEDWTAAKAAWAAHLESRESPRWFFTPDDRDALTAAHATHYGGLSRHITEAETVRDRVFTFLGVTIELEQQVDWTPHINEWNHMLNRFGYFIDLGRAYWATGDEVYAEEFADLLRQWVAGNPVPEEVVGMWHQHGTSWRTLEAGIRSWHWMEAMQYFMHSPAFDAETKYLMSRSLIEHGRRLLGKQYQYWAGNWQVNECRALVGLGVMFPEFEEAAAWRETGLQYLAEHVEKDVYPDGMHHEVVPSYHIGIINYYTEAPRLLALNGFDASALTERHERMFDALMTISYPNGVYPPIGNTMRSGSRQMSGILGIGALLYDRGDFRALGSDTAPEAAFWLFGPEVFDRYAAITPETPDPSSRALPDGRYAVMRTGWDAEDQYLLFDASPRLGGHKHADRLQVIVYAGRELLIDPGMYSYDQPGYNDLRTPENHNTLVIDGLGQPNRDPDLLHWHADEEVDLAVGEFLAHGVRHERSVLYLRGDYWIVLDQLTEAETGDEGDALHGEARELTRYFHFPLGDARFDPETQTAATDFESGTNIAVTGLDDAVLTPGEGYYPIDMTEIARHPRAAFTLERRLPVTLGTALIPYADADSKPQVRHHEIDAAGRLFIEVEHADGTVDVIALAPTQAAEAWQVLVLRYDADGDLLTRKQL